MKTIFTSLIVFCLTICFAFRPSANVDLLSSLVNYKPITENVSRIDTFSSTNLNTADYKVKNLSDYVPKYKDKHRIVIKTIEQRTDLSLEEKLKLVVAEVNKLRKEFSTERTKEYENKEVTLSVEHSCTSESSGGKKDCKYKCVSAPAPGLVTSKDWNKVEGDNKGTTISEDRTTACLRMTVAGKGRNFGILKASFRYEPNWTAKTVQKETDQLFLMVTENN